ncbi:MAG: hypothetical protein EOS07_07525 [Mesorhizobium sp.]|uniref:S8 family serine peptidase n=1 Tax=Mesorhizobium sp. TaxID=1871066 RepID=UPI000FE3DC77|nr:S8 family serine peptidase [Mesorhizobium sp.]RWO10996.1 MAG: hypothetical protein EOS07_07525 [Mesorhizobium sp.]RWP07912.1 MAG: hypothetical protein EOQ99_04135 [Mesorhizobium sp.]RWQ22692.1 MAG: hypothetical protein EOR92_06650 [Mesorhizobium sp.]RWQ55223.1 MAG: hypothetical protein EOS84_11715 [Mesorhizobium sp.]RWQ61589.1 MAG: hypothetical protein EOS83_00495 [Mesorhizobium sp.]
MAALDPELELLLQYEPPQLAVRLLIDWSGTEADLVAKGVKLLAPVEDDTAMVELPLSVVAKLRGDPDIGYMELLPHFAPELNVSRGVVNAPPSLGTGGFDGPTGEGVTIGIIDADMDVFHESLRNPDGTSRVVALWDMHAISKTARIDGLRAPEGFRTGLAYSKSDIDLALSKPVTGEDKQTRKRREKLSGNLRMLRGNGHGTGVAGIAAGNGRSNSGAAANIGIAPDANLAVVVVRSLSDWAMAMRYLRRVMTGKPGVINLSAGEHHGPHLPGGRVERWFGAFIEKSGIPLVKSAGNGGGSGGHATDVIKKGKGVSLQVLVQPGATKLTQQMRIQIWYGYGGGDPALAATITPPGSTVAYDIPYGGTCAASPSVIKASNRKRPDHLGLSAIGLRIKPQPGLWTVRLTAPKDKDVRFHAWIAWSASSTGEVSFATTGLVTDAASFTVPAAIPNLITVASFTTKDQSGNPTPDHKIATYSAHGPAADGVTPVITIAAPGQRILTADPPDPTATDPPPGKTDRYVLKNGTSFAAPHVTGAIALMLEKEPLLTPAMIVAFLRKKPDTTLDPHIWGAGRLDIKKVLAEIGTA